MKTFYQNRLKTFIVTLLFAIVAAQGLPAVAAQPYKVAILPFSMNAEKDLSFLQNGITTMLASRLAWTDQVTVIGREETANALTAAEGFSGESRALLVGGKLKADYVLFGSLTVFGHSVSIDAKMVDVTGQRPPFVFFTQSQGMDTVIPEINRFATDINATVFGRTPVAHAPQPAVAAPAPVPASTPAPETQRMHPDKLLADAAAGAGIPKAAEQPAPSAAAAATPQAPAGSSFVPTESAKETSADFWKSRTFKLLFNGIAVGDVDGDRQNETVIITPHGVQVFRLENRRLVKVFEVPDDRGLNLVGVDVADINGNGLAEIFVTALNTHRNRLRSFVLEADGRTLKTLTEGEGWYYRVLEVPGQGATLFGQEESYTGGPFKGNVHQMAWQGGTYAPGEEILSARQTSLLGMAYGDVTGDGEPDIVAYDTSDKLQLVSASGRATWTSADRYGGSTLYYVLPKNQPDIDNLQYLPMRVAITDLDGNGVNEVVVVSNADIAKNLLDQFRQYNQGHFESLSWDGLGLASNWKTRSVSGYLRDFAVADFDNDGKKELIAALVIKEGRIIGFEANSAVIAYELQ